MILPEEVLFRWLLPVSFVFAVINRDTTRDPPLFLLGFQLSRDCSTSASRRRGGPRPAPPLGLRWFDLYPPVGGLLPSARCFWRTCSGHLWAIDTWVVARTPRYPTWWLRRLRCIPKKTVKPRRHVKVIQMANKNIRGRSNWILTNIHEGKENFA